MDALGCTSGQVVETEGCEASGAGAEAPPKARRELTEGDIGKLCNTNWHAQ